VAYQLKIDHVTQGPSGAERRADPLSVDFADFVWIYVAYDLPMGARPKGEASLLDDPGQGRFPVNGDDAGPGMYRFGVSHFSLTPRSRYMFRFADNLRAPTYEDQLEVRTV